MPGMVFVIFKKSLLPVIQEQKRSFYFDLYSQYTGFQKTGQMQYTPPVQVAYALRQAIDEYFAEGEKAGGNRYRESWETLYEWTSDSWDFNSCYLEQYESADSAGNC